MAWELVELTCARRQVLEVGEQVGQNFLPIEHCLKIGLSGDLVIASQLVEEVAHIQSEVLDVG